MAKLYSYIMFLTFAIVAASLFFSGHVKAEPNCDNDWNILDKKCTEFVKTDKPPVLPSNDCCQAIEKAGLPCACNKVTAEIENKLSVPLAIMVASFCGRPLPHGVKCGSVTIP